MARARSFPEVNWAAVLLGTLVAVVVATIVGVLLVAVAPIFGVLAPISGIASGAFLAGKRAKRAPLYHGALVAAGYVLLEGIGVVPPPLPPMDNALADSVAIILSDASLLSVGALAGWLARGSSSSSDTDRDR
jgi:hypothetical protein